MTIENGEFVPDSADEIEDAMMETAKEYFGDDLNDDQYAVIRLFYRPVAEQFASIQEDIGLVLASAQIDNATGRALDLLTALIGVPRRPAQRARGEVIFSRDSAAGKDYFVPRGTIVQTDSIEPIRFETTEEGVIEEGTTETPPISVRAIEGGEQSNLGQNTLTVMPDPPNGVHSVTNPDQVSGGVDEETDDELRERAKNELSEGSAATAAALISAARSVDGVRDVTIFINDTDTDNHYGNGLPAHSFELVVFTEDSSVQKEVGQNILDTKAAGDYSAAGINGEKVTITGELPNGQTHDVSYSEPQPVQIYVDVDLVKTEEYTGDDDVVHNIVGYLGGTYADGSDAYGLGVGDDVIYTKVQQAVLDVQGVHDINSLTIGKSADPTGTSNIAIDNFEVATGNATDDSITITTTNK